MAVVTEPAGLPLWSDYPRFVRRHLATIGACMVLGLLVGVVWSWGQSPTYSATASVTPAPVPKYVVPSTVGLVPPEVSIDTDAQLLHSPHVLRAVADVLDVDADTASRHVSVTASPNSRVLHVTVSARSASAAAAAANAAAAALADVRRAVLGSLRLDQLRQLRLLISYEEQEFAQDGAHGVAVPAYDRGYAKVQELRTNLQELEQARQQPVEQLRSAVPPRHADYANTEVPLVSGGMVGLLFGCLLGAGRERAARPARRHAIPRLGPHPLGLLPGGVTRDEDYHHAV
jgi:hypothetical protein